MMKLLIAGLAMIATGLGLVVFTDRDPAVLFIGGVICSFIAVIHGGTPAYDRGAAVSAGSTDDAFYLSNLKTTGSVDPNARFIGGD